MFEESREQIFMEILSEKEADELIFLLAQAKTDAHFPDYKAIPEKTTETARATLDAYIEALEQVQAKGPID